MEAAALDVVCFVKRALTLAMGAPRDELPNEVAAALEKVTIAVERIFMDAAGIVRTGPAYGARTERQRAEIDSECLSMQFQNGAR